MSVEAIGHELKLSIRRDEGDRAVVLKARQADTLVELHIFQLYWFTLPSYTYKIKIISEGYKYQKNVTASHELVYCIFCEQHVVTHGCEVWHKTFQWVRKEEQSHCHSCKLWKCYLSLSQLICSIMQLLVAQIIFPHNQTSVCHERELTSSVFKQNLVVEAQPQLGHPRQEDTHLNGADDLTAENITVGTDLKKSNWQLVSEDLFIAACILEDSITSSSKSAVHVK